MRCQRYGLQKTIATLNQSDSNHPRIQCQHKERISDVSYVRCGGNHPANYKGCMVCKDLLMKTYPLLLPKIYTPPAQFQQTVYTQPGVTYA
jgi:hypothetical protein